MTKECIWFLYELLRIYNSQRQDESAKAKKSSKIFSTGGHGRNDISAISHGSVGSRLTSNEPNKTSFQFVISRT